MMKNQSLVETFLEFWLPEVNDLQLNFKEIKGKIENLHKNCYDFDLKSREEHVLMDITFDKKSHNFFDLESKNVENQPIPVCKQGISKDISKKLSKNYEDVQNEVWK